MQVLRSVGGYVKLADFKQAKQATGQQTRFLVLVVGLHESGKADYRVYVEIDTPEVVTPTPTPSGRAGWYLVGVKQHTSPDAGLRFTEGIYYKFVGAEGDKGNFTVTIWGSDWPTRDSDLHFEWVSKVRWDDPPPYLEPGQKVSFRLAHSVLKGPPETISVSVSFDHDSFRCSSPTPHPLSLFDTISFFGTPDGNVSAFGGFDGVLQSKLAIPRGRPGDRRAIVIRLPALYGFSYHYEWRE